MNFLQRFVWFTLSTVATFYIATLIFPKNLVFGNAIFPQLQAIVNTSVIVGLAAALVGEFGRTRKYPMKTWFIIYWIVNAGVIYILARTPISLISAIGISAFWVSIILGGVVNYAQYGTFRALTVKKKK